MANHYRVSPKFWPKARRRGWGDSEITLALYLLTCDHRNLEGLYRLPKAYIANDLGWARRKVDTVLGKVCASGLAEYDEDAQMVLIPKALKHQAPATENQIKGAITQLERIPRTSLWHAFRIACASHCPRLADAVDRRWPSVADDSLAGARGEMRANARGERTLASSSSSNSSTPPTPPRGGRARDRTRYEGDLAEFSVRHFPGVPAGLIAQQAAELRARGHEPTPDALRPLIDRWQEAPTP